jgi:hypothetical protein
MNKQLRRAKFFRDIGKFFSDMYEQHGITFMLVDYDRTPEEQQRYFEQGKSRTLNSKHLHWLAVDVVLVNEDGTLVWTDEERYQIAGRAWRDLGGEWQPIPGDVGHFADGQPI